MGMRRNPDGSITVGRLEDVFTPEDVKVPAKAEEITSPDVKPQKPKTAKTTRKTVKK